MTMALDPRNLVTKDDLLQVKADLLQFKEDLRADLRHLPTKGDLWRAIAFQTIALTGIVAAITKL